MYSTQIHLEMAMGVLDCLWFEEGNIQGKKKTQLCPLAETDYTTLMSVNLCVCMSEKWPIPCLNFALWQSSNPKQQLAWYLACRLTFCLCVFDTPTTSTTMIRSSLCSLAPSTASRKWSRWVSDCQCQPQVVKVSLTSSVSATYCEGQSQWSRSVWDCRCQPQVVNVSLTSSMSATYCEGQSQDGFLGSVSRCQGQFHIVRVRSVSDN